MDIVDQIDNLAFRTPGDIFERAADTIVLERLIADKLYRALNTAISGSRADSEANGIISEALWAYEMARGADFHV